MFAKPYKLKSNSTLKNSEKKQLVQLIRRDFPNATEEICKELVPNKSSTSHMKLVTHSGEIIGVYVVDGYPIIIEIGSHLIPTMNVLWKHPCLIPSIIIHSLVLAKLQAGAPLYLPGVVSTGVNFPSFPLGSPIALCTEDNAAAAAVGYAAMSSADMMMRTSGICFDLVHIISDHLWKDLKFNKLIRPQLGPAFYPGDVSAIQKDFSKISLATKKQDNEWPSLVPVKVESEPNPDPPVKAPNEPALILDPQTDVHMNNVELIEADNVMQVESDIPSDMDGLLRYCLLSFIKFFGKKVEFPLKTNIWYKNNLMPMCPSGHSIDIKKSSYKKLGKFLEAMQKESLLEVREIEKGVDAITAINCLHPLLKTHTADKPIENIENNDERSKPPVLVEKLSITAKVLPLFSTYKKGTPLPLTQVRNSVSEYVKIKGLNEQKGNVVLDETLANIVDRPVQERMKWDVLMSKISEKMTACTEIRNSDGSVRLIRSKVDPIKMTVVTRSGNKKATLVSNLSTFGLIESQLANECQSKAATACCVTRTPSDPRDQLMLQGDQTYFMVKLLMDEYGLPKKYIEGADKALKKKKC